MARLSHSGNKMKSVSENHVNGKVRNRERADCKEMLNGQEQTELPCNNTLNILEKNLAEFL